MGVDMITEEEIYNSKNRIQNARVARDNCKKDSWGWLYWDNVRGTLVRQLRREINKNFKEVVNNLSE